jgi:hypothetical protein
MTPSASPILDSLEIATTPRWARIDLLVLALLVAGLMIVYSGALLLPYGNLDDYYWLYYSHIPSYWDFIKDSLSVQGRPINAWITALVFHRTHGIRGLTGIRALTILGLAGMTWTFYLAMIRAGWARVESALVAAIAAAVPTIQVHAAWASSVPIPLGGIASAAAALLCGWSLTNLSRRWPALLAAAALVAIACMIYQPAAMVFWPIAALDCFAPIHADRRLLRRAGVYLISAAGGLIAGWVVFKIGLHLYPWSAQADRTGFTIDPVEKARQFALNPLTDNLALFFLDPSRRAAEIVAILLLVGLFLYFPGPNLRRSNLVILSLLLFPLADLPNLLSQANSWAYRTQMGMAWLMIVLSWLAIQGYWRFLTSNSKPIPLTALAIIAMACNALAAWNVVNLIAWPQSIEMAILKTRLTDVGATSAQRVILLAPIWSDSPASFCRYDEFGKPTLSADTMCVPMLNIFCGRLSPDATPIKLRLVKNWQGPWIKPLKPGVVLVDMRDLRLTSWNN